jgi:hypothetical protein
MLNDTPASVDIPQLIRCVSNDRVPKGLRCLCLSRLAEIRSRGRWWWEIMLLPAVPPVRPPSARKPSPGFSVWSRSPRPKWLVGSEILAPASSATDADLEV